MKKLISIVCLTCCVIVVGTFYSCSRKGEVATLSSDLSSTFESKIDEATTEMIVQQETISKEEIYVHICGAVNIPGVYKISEDKRLYELIGLAGGLTEYAVGDAVNQASLLEDGQKIYIPTIEDMESTTLYLNETKEDDGLVNINTATKDELMSLPGIGEAKANSIIDYRTTNGDFNTIEDIKLIPGIKDSVYNKISDKIKVK